MSQESRSKVMCFRWQVGSQQLQVASLISEKHLCRFLLELLSYIIANQIEHFIRCPSLDRAYASI